MEEKNKSFGLVDITNSYGENLQEVPVQPEYKLFNPDGSIDEETFFFIFGNDIRRKILSKLSKFPRYASDLAIDLGVSKQAVKKQLDKLIEYGIIEIFHQEHEDKKRQFYQINNDIALFCQITITPNFFNTNIENNPIEFANAMRKMTHDPRYALTIPGLRHSANYSELNTSLGSLGKKLNTIEKDLQGINEEYKQMQLKKMAIINRIQMILNNFLRDDLEKEVIFSLFFNIDKTIEGLTLDDILHNLFLRKKKRAGSKDLQHKKTDAKTIQRGQELLKLLEILIKNFGFIRSEGDKLFFNFE